MLQLPERPLAEIGDFTGADDFEGNEWLRRRSRPREENSFERDSSKVMVRPPWGRLTEVGNEAPPCNLR